MKRIRYKDRTLFETLLMLIVFAFLFYRQVVVYDGKYPSDMSAHIYIAMTQESYSLFYRIIRACVLLSYNHYPILIALLEASATVITWIVAYATMVDNYGLNVFKAKCISAGLLVLSSIYIPVIYPHFYGGTLVTQPWHNITYVVMRCFSVCAIYFIWKIISNCEFSNMREMLFFSLFTFLATAIKPSFFVTFAPAILLVAMEMLINKIISFRKTLWVGLTFVPSAFICLFQSIILYGNKNADGSSVVFSLSQYMFMGTFRDLICKFLCGISFPVIILLFDIREKDYRKKIVIYGFCMSLIQAMFLSETGPRTYHGNFMWGVYIGSYFLFMVATSIWSKKARSEFNNTKKKLFLYYIASLLIVMHMISGIVYFIRLLAGAQY